MKRHLKPQLKPSAKPALKIDGEAALKSALKPLLTAPSSLCLLLVGTLFLFACAGRPEETRFIREIDALEDNPRLVLSTLDTTGLERIATFDQALGYLKVSLARHYLRPDAWPDETRITRALALFRARDAYEPLLETLCLMSHMYESREEADKQIACIQEAISLSRDAADDEWLFFLYDNLSYMYLRRYDLVKYYKYQQAAHDCLHMRDARSFNLPAQIQIGKNYLYLDKPREAVRLLESVEKALAPTHIGYADCQRYLGMAYLKENQPDKAIAKIKAFAATAGRPLALEDAPEAPAGPAGSYASSADTILPATPSVSSVGPAALATPFVFPAGPVVAESPSATASSDIVASENTTLAAMLLTQAYYQAGDFATAARYREQAGRRRLSPQHYRIQIRFYETCARMASEEHNPAQAAAYWQALHAFDREIIAKLNTRTLDEVILRYEMKKERKAKEAYARRLYLLAGLLIFAALAALGFYRWKRKQYLRGKYELAQRIEVLEKLNDSRANLHDELKNFILRDFEIAKKIALLKGLESENDKRFISRIDTLFLTRENKLLMRQWDQFYQQVDLYQHGFYTRLTQAYPSLTEKEIQLSCLLMVGFNTAEIAAVWSQSIYSVHKYKTSIRKKAGLPEGADLVAEFTRLLAS